MILKRKPGRVVAIIEDDGTGFDVTRPWTVAVWAGGDATSGPS